jgi:hypothetical protein
MVKFLQIFTLLLLPVLGFSQAVVSILPPSDYVGNYDFTVTVDTELPWGVPDLEDPANAIQAPLVVARDGSEADSLLCDEGGVVNGDEVAGKIALVYRNECFFDQKCLRAQQAGAIGVIIVNRLGADPINMSSPNDGTGVGDQVTIPVVMVQGEDVQNWRAEVNAGTMVAFIGNKNGLYDDDLGIAPSTVRRAEFYALPHWLNQADGDYVVSPSAGIINYGSNTQTNVSLNAVITRNGVELYNETSDPVLAIASGDTSNFLLPDYAVPSGISNRGNYEINYSVVFSAEDEFPSDNSFQAGFALTDSTFSYGSLEEDESPNPKTFFRPTAATESALSCIHFRNANAGAVSAQAVGMTFAASYGGEDMTGVVVDVYAYEWTNEFTDVDDPNFDLTDESLEELNFGSFEYLDNEQENLNIYVPFEEGPIELQDEVRYLFCVNYLDAELFTGFDNSSVDYTQNFELYRQPLWPLQSNDGDFVAVTHFGFEIAPSYSVTMFSPTSIDEPAKKVDVQAYPNPAREWVNVIVPGQSEEVLVNTYDVSGKLVLTKTLRAVNGSIQIPLNGLEKGAYIFNLTLSNGSYANFNLMVIE